jgi:hypothetical protein
VDELNWQLREQRRRNAENNSIPGVGPNNARNMKAFMAKFSPRHGPGDADVERLFHVHHRAAIPGWEAMTSDSGVGRRPARSFLRMLPTPFGQKNKRFRFRFRG